MEEKGGERRERSGIRQDRGRGKRRRREEKGEEKGGKRRDAEGWMNRVRKG